MSRIDLRWLLLVPALALAQQGPLPAPVALQENGNVLVRTSWSLQLPNPARAIHFIRDDFILLHDGNRYRFLTGESPGSGTAAALRTLPRQLTRASFKHATPDGGSLIFETVSSRETIDIRGLLDGHVRSAVAGNGASPVDISEPLLTPITTLFWKPTRALGYVGPGQGKRAEVIATFSTPRANESIEEYEPFDCPFPPHLARPDGPWIWVPTRTQVYEHSLRDRKGNELVFFTALESGDITYLSEPEATARGCEASYRRNFRNAPQSYEVSHEQLPSDEHVIQVHLLDQGVPAGGVPVRVRESRDAQEPSCVDSTIGNLPDLDNQDGLTLANGSYAWKRFRNRQRSRDGGGRRNNLDFTDNSVVAKLCIRVDGTWLPVWRSPRESGGYRVRCDLAIPGAQRCTQIR